MKDAVRYIVVPCCDGEAPLSHHCTHVPENTAGFIHCRENIAR